METVAALIRSIASATVWTIAGLMALAELGLNLGPLIAGAGIVGVAVGFGAQNLVALNTLRHLHAAGGPVRRGVT